MPAPPIDIAAALGTDPEVGPAPEPSLDDPLAGLLPFDEDPELDEDGEELGGDPDLEMCAQVWPEWTPEQHQGLLDLIDARLLGKPEAG
jgi:hypothetical protein